MAAATEPVQREWRIVGTDEDGLPETTVVVLADNPWWSAGVADAESRYYVETCIDETDCVIDIRGFNNIAAAEDYAREQRTAITEGYGRREVARHRERSKALMELTADWAEDEDDCRAAVALAEAIGRGQAGAALKALQTAGLA